MCRPVHHTYVCLSVLPSIRLSAYINPSTAQLGAGRWQVAGGRRRVSCGVDSRCPGVRCCGARAGSVPHHYYTIMDGGLGMCEGAREGTCTTTRMDTYSSCCEGPMVLGVQSCLLLGRLHTAFASS